MSTPVAGLDLAELTARATAAAKTLGADAVVANVRPLPGGQSSLTFVATLSTLRSRRAVVLKVAPPGLEPVRNRDVLRQARLLRALAGVRDMLVPAVLFEDPGAPPDVPPLYAMTFVPGTAFEPHLDDASDDTSEIEVGARARHAARLLALLHRQRPGELGLADAATTLPMELDRWERALSTVTEIAGDASQHVATLRREMPDDEPARIVHGDFRLGNMLARGGRVEAVIDWEIWAVEDPRVDLAWWLLCADAEWHPTATRSHPGMPGAAELMREYAISGGPASARDAAWFRSLALTKMAASTALIAKHLRRAGDHATAQTTAAPVPLMLERAANALGPSGQSSTNRLV